MTADGPSPWPLRPAAFAANLDRFLAAPMLVAIARRFEGSRWLGRPGRRTVLGLYGLV
jgi:hypothetical protein